MRRLFVFNDTCKYCFGMFQKGALYHVLHVGSRWEDLRPHTVVVVQQSHHIPGGNVALHPTVRHITAAPVSPAQVNAELSHAEGSELRDVGQNHSCSGAWHHPQDGSQDQVTAAHMHGTAVDRAS